MLNPDFCPWSDGQGCQLGPRPSPIHSAAWVTGQVERPCGGQDPVTARCGKVCTHVVNVTLAKTVTPTCVRAGGEVLYTIALKNGSTLPLLEVVLTDPAARWLEVGTVRLNGVKLSGDLEAGVALPEIGPGGTAVVTFTARPREDTPSPLENTALVDYRVCTDCGKEAAQVTSNPAVLTVLAPGLALEKEADRCWVGPEEPVLTYTLWVTNTGNVTLDHVTVTDQLPDQLACVPGTTRVRGGPPEDLDPARGMGLGRMLPGEKASVSFQAEWQD